MKIKNKVINVEILDILNKFKDYLFLNGIDRFREINEQDKYIMITCPMHKSGMERHSSCGILKYDDGDKPAGLVHCFTCNYVASFDKMISDIMNQNDGGEFGRRWLLETFGEASEEVREDLSIDCERVKNKAQKVFISEEELDKYRYIHPYLYKRKMTDEIIEKFDLGYDKATRTVTFPVNDINGNCVFVAKRSVEGKFFSYPSGSEKPIYLLDYIVKNKIKEVYVCESAFNALTLWVYGIPAVALFGTGSAHQYNLLNSCGVRSYVLCFDGDKAGDIGRSRFINNVKGALIYSIEIPRNKDVNDLEKEEFLKLEKALEK